MTIGPFVTRASEFSSLEERMRSVFHLNSRLPDGVFMKGWHAFRVVEFHLMLTDRFWKILSACAANACDVDVEVLVLEPDPNAYYFENFGRYGALRLDATSSPADYFESLQAEPEGSPADALLHAATVMAWCGSSKSWAFWGERQLGIGIAATRRAEWIWPSIEGIEWFDMDSAIADLVATGFPDQVVPNTVATRLRNNYQG